MRTIDRHAVFRLLIQNIQHLIVPVRESLRRVAADDVVVVRFRPEEYLQIAVSIRSEYRVAFIREEQFASLSRRGFFEQCGNFRNREIRLSRREERFFLRRRIFAVQFLYRIRAVFSSQLFPPQIVISNLFIREIVFLLICGPVNLALFHFFDGYILRDIIQLHIIVLPVVEMR